MRKYRKMRRPTRRKSAIRRRARRPTKGKSTEVKYLTLTQQDIPSQIAYSPATASLFQEQHVFSDHLAYIDQGTNRDQRVGSKIYVKFATFHLWTWACPESFAQYVDNYHIRCIVSNTGNTRVAAGNNIANYFGSLEKRNINGLINRSNVTVYHDKIYKVSGSASNNNPESPDNILGVSRRISFTVPIGHLVDYVNDSVIVRNDRDYICLMLIVGCPGMSVETNALQICCTDMTIRYYFTDA